MFSLPVCWIIYGYSREKLHVRWADADIDLKCLWCIYRVFYFFVIYNFSVWTVLRGLQRKSQSFVFSSWIMHALDNLIFRKQMTVWMDWHLLLWEFWKVLRERRQQIWFKDMVEKLPTQWARKRVISSWDGILGRVNFPSYIVMYSSKEDEKRTVNINLSVVPFSLIFIPNPGVAYS